jgi:ubiquinone/menaquinone biosynthesis C-methylase UbiE
MDKYFWDTKLEYLKNTRTHFWNDDYFEFLVKSVWKINKPVKIIDFGCGYGYLGMKLLPLLPEGSSYTGVDKGVELLNEARNLYSNSPFQNEFICADLVDYIPESKYDIAICQAVLRHIPKSEAILQKMINSVVPAGKVICIEVNRVMEEAGFYLHETQHSEIEVLASYNAQWNNELNTTGRDYRMGIKIPILMQKLGLHNVGVRLNDFVKFISPLSGEENYPEHIATFLDEKGFSIENQDNLFALSARCLVISYGTKF